MAVTLEDLEYRQNAQAQLLEYVLSSLIASHSDREGFLSLLANIEQQAETTEGPIPVYIAMYTRRLIAQTRDVIAQLG